MYKRFLFCIISIFILTGISFSQEKSQKEFELLNKISEAGDWEFRNFEVQLNFIQPVDHNNPDGPKFPQRIFIRHAGFDKPVVLSTSGYYANPARKSEPTRILEANEILVEHRYFPPSVPDSVEWQYLNVEQSAKDFHAIIQFMKQFYKGKWITTGGSKGGQTVLFHRSFYPDDVDVTIAYVAPLNLAMEDERIVAYLADSISTPEARQRMLDCQRAMLERRDEIIPLLKADMEKNNEHFIRDFDLSYEYSVFETNFAWWQYGPGDENQIPLPDAPAEDLFNFLQNGAGFFCQSSNDFFKPFNYQAYTEIGFYGYDVTPFKDLLKYVKGDYASNRIFLVEDDWDISFDPSVMKTVNDFLMTKGNNIIYIYGQFDPWGSTGVWPSPKTNALRMTLKGGNHGTRILSFQGEEREKILTTLENWLDLKINRQILERLN